MSNEYADERAHDVSWMTAAERNSHIAAPSADQLSIINMETMNETGNTRIAHRFAAERARVESFNRHMIMACMNLRTALWESTPRKISADRIYIASF